MNKTVGRAGRTNSEAKLKKPRSQLIKKKQEVSLSLCQENGKLSQKCQYSNPFNVILYFLSFYFTCQSGIVIKFDNLDQNKPRANRCSNFRSRDLIWGKAFLNSIWRKMSRCFQK